MKSIHVLRKPCSRSAPTVAANVLRHGTGAINVDACRIGITPDDVNHRPGQTKTTNQTSSMFGMASQKRGTLGTGRWPANLILQHLDGCVQDGVKKVKVIGATAHQKDHKTHSWVAEGTQTHEHAGFRDPDGTETVAAWTCAEGCPVAALDAQSGVRKDGVAVRHNGVSGGSGTSIVRAKPVGTPDIGYGGGGGASRFFKQVGGKVTLSGGGRGRTG